MSEKQRWVAVRQPHRMPQVWHADRVRCVSDRVFDDQEDLVAAAPELRDSTIELGRLVRDFMSGKLVTADEAHRAIDAATKALAKAEGKAS